jgi:triosephosphate isomerase
VGRKPLIAGNWKMNLTHLEAIALMQKFAFALPEKYYDKVEVAVLPPFTHIRSIQTMTAPRTSPRTTRAPTPATCPG